VLGSKRKTILNNIRKKESCKRDSQCDSQFPFRYKINFGSNLWNEISLHFIQTKEETNKRELAYEKSENGRDLIGDPTTATTPRFKPVKNVKDDDEKYSMDQAR